MDKLGKYTILGELGRGAMGIVYLGEDPYIGRKVALKTIRFESFTQPAEQEMAQERFMREARSAGNLSHPNIVTIYEVGEDKGVTYIAMECIEGRSLEELIASGKKFSLEEITRLAAQISSALDYAHSRGVIHRDIKPANILIDEEGRPHIVDFGIARFTSSTMTFTRAIIGTPYFMSPEQIAGKNIDHRADIFSLGTILYELFAGDKPFPGDNITSVMYKIVHEPHSPVRDLKKNLPPQIDSILDKALAKKPQDRYSSCAELTSDLQKAQDQPELTNYPGSFISPKKATGIKETEESAEFGAPREKSNRPILFLLLGMMALVAVVTVAIYIYFPEKPAPSPRGKGSADPVSSSPSEAAYLQAGKNFMEEGKHKEALSEFRKALNQDAGNLEAQLGAANALREMDKPLDAAQEYEKAIALDSADFRPYLYLGEIYDGLGEEDKALAFYKHFLDISPDHMDTSKPAQRVEQIEEKLFALPEVKPEEKEAPPEIPRKKEEKPVRAEPEKKKTVKKEEEIKQEPVKPEIDVNRMFSQGIKALREEDYQGCIRQMEAILEYDPSHSQARYYLTVAKKSMEKEEQRVSEKERLARRIEAAVQKVRKNFEAGKYRETIEAAEEIFRLNPGNPEALKYIDAANMKMAPLEIQSVVESYIQSIKTNSLVSFYQSRCIPSLFQQIRRDTETISKLYHDFQAMASNVKIDISRTGEGGYEARVSFSHIWTGVSKSKQTREALFEGKMSWVMKKTDDKWKISKIEYNASNK